MPLSSSKVLPFQQVAHLPSPEDNCAVAKRFLESGTQIHFGSSPLQLDYDVLEGHRFAVKRIAAGEALLSWGLPFGYAQTEITPGCYVSNQGTLEELKRRQIDSLLPSAPSFENHYEPYEIDEQAFRAGQQVPLYNRSRTFQGYFRGSSRGVGTRNYIVILASSSKSSSFARTLSRVMKDSVDKLKNVDGLIPIAHTEAGAADRPNNLEHILRTLAGFVVHPNVGAVLISDTAPSWVDRSVLQRYMETHHYPLSDVLHDSLIIGRDFPRSLEMGQRIVESWLEKVNSAERSSQPLRHLKVALQCGGSDSFSGLTSNPLLSISAMEILKNGGSANLAETNELVGAESYVLSNVKELKTAQQFIFKIQEFKQMMKWHGHTPEQNPSGGNLYRGLYNIALKSIGAARKRHPDVRLDQVIEYAERMVHPGFYFMNSPGNDLESIAGQVASGTNIIFFSTGNGSITNFPFVPTIKVMSNTRRYELMPADMDLNAGAHLDGISLDILADEMFELTLKVASGYSTRGERANHSQVSIWRNWEQTQTTSFEASRIGQKTDGRPIKLPTALPDSEGESVDFGKRQTAAELGLILPNSLCSSQVARVLAERLNQRRFSGPFTRFVSLSHTEGCGAVRGPSQELLVRTLIGYMTHPLVHSCVLLEHGCENVHHQYLRQELIQKQLSPSQFGWISIQLDGGIDKAASKAETWFRAQTEERATARPFSIAIAATGMMPEQVSRSLADLTRTLVKSGATVVVPEGCDSLLRGLGLSEDQAPSLLYADRVEYPGFHVMETTSSHWVEILTGLGATGAELILAYVSQDSCQGHVFVPVLQFSESSLPELDLVLSGLVPDWTQQLLEAVAKTAAGSYLPRALRTGNTDSQIPRGPWGFSV